MTTIPGLIPALVEYYNRLEADLECDIAEFGFSRQKISFEVVLHPDGALHSFADARLQADGRHLARTLVVPGQSKPSGSGVNPCFLWDNAQYMLGFKLDDPKPDRTRKTFEAFRERHLEVEKEVDDEAFTAVCAFLRS